MMLAILLVGICGISALPQNIWYTETFGQAECEICDERCFMTDEARCGYYNLVKEILENNTDRETHDDINNGIDDMIFDYMEKDNICLGCETCKCGVDGLWNCTFIQRCDPDDELPLDHHTLVVTMENLKEYKKTILNKRIKRSIQGKKKEVMSDEEVLKWMYDTKEYNINKDSLNDTTDKINSKEISVNKTDASIKKDEANISNLNSEPLVFQDLLNNINLDNDEKHISLEDSRHSGHTMFHKLASPNVFNDIKKSILADTIILNYEEENNTQTDRIVNDVFSYIDSDVNENFNYKRDIHKPRRIQKREDKESIYDNSTTSANETEKSVMEIHDVLYPLDRFVEQKQYELDKLLDIKKKFIAYIKTITGINFTDHYTNFTKDNSHLYFIDMDLISNYSEDLRRRDPNMLSKYLAKLKRDIHEVISDVVGIQRLTNYSSMPYELKVLIRAMKNYVTKEKKDKIKKKKSSSNSINLRKTFDMNNAVEKMFCPIDEIIKIFETLDDSILISNALYQLSPVAKKIILRLVNRFYTNDLKFTISTIDLTENTSHALNKVGETYDKMTADIANSPLPERLYVMKLFHLVLSQDIKKLTDVLAMFQFAQNRRMTTIDDVAGEKLIGRISSDLRRSSHRLGRIIQLQILKKGIDTSTERSLKKKKSFLLTIKTLLRNSKKEINRLLRRKVPKNEIVKHIAKKKMDEIRKNKISEYEETMRKWQKNLNIASRYKRKAGWF
ncbi:unnamed protein product [Danaus chrysippus]|uniref:(African queen) hypothetical protein n=1 Tax=Danaus chrysippus TaxID=151541 RepID=A0A8J2QVK0_9NEOP|nr:unnamed protein product [Danaus chrysippus]